MIKRIDHIEIAVKDVEEAIDVLQKVKLALGGCFDSNHESAL